MVNKLPIDLPLVLLILASIGLLYFLSGFFLGVTADQFGSALVVIASCVSSALIGCELQRERWYGNYWDESVEE